MRLIRTLKPMKNKYQEEFSAMKKASTIFTALIVIFTLFLIVLGFLLKVKSESVEQNSYKPDRQILRDIGMVLIILGLIIITIVIVLYLFIRTEHLFFLTIAIFILLILISCQIVFIAKPTSIATLLLHKEFLISDYSKDDISFDEEGRVVFPNSESGIRWSFVQIAFKCCGFSGPRDYDIMLEREVKLGRGLGKLEQMRLPLSCCKLDLDYKFLSYHTVSQQQIKRCLINDPTNYNENGCFGINWRRMNPITYTMAVIILAHLTTNFIQLFIFSVLINKRTKFYKSPPKNTPRFAV